MLQLCPSLKALLLCIYWYHGIEEPRFLLRFYARVYIRFQIFLNALSVRNADKIVSVSRYAAEQLKGHTGLESEVIYNRIDPEIFHTGYDGDEIRRKHNLGSAPVILFVGALRPQKGVHLLVQAFKLVKNKCPEARLVIVGKPERTFYFNKFKANVGSSVIFIDFVPQKVLPRYYAMCDIYATGALWESFNNPLAEAQACGKPVVAFNIGPHPEIINGNSILVEAGNVEAFADACLTKLEEVRRAKNLLTAR